MKEEELLKQLNIEKKEFEKEKEWISALTNLVNAIQKKNENANARIMTCIFTLLRESSDLPSAVGICEVAKEQMLSGRMQKADNKIADILMQAMESKKGKMEYVG